MADLRRWVIGWQFVLALFCGCSSQPGGNQSPARPEGAKVRIALLPKIKGISYFSSCYQGAQRAAAEMPNVELIYDGPIDGDPKKQAEMIEQWIVE
jgi:rhamnose transport system substrate-binding protein